MIIRRDFIKEAEISKAKGLAIAMELPATWIIWLVESPTK